VKSFRAWVGVAVVSSIVLPALPSGAIPVWGPAPVGRYGEACHVYSTDTMGPPNYRVADIGKPGVPKLDAAQTEIVEQILSFKGTDPGLWFTFLPNKNAPVFIVFDASGFDDQPRPCVYVPLGYPVLSARCDCYYESGEQSHLSSGDGGPPIPKPWLTASP